MGAILSLNNSRYRARRSCGVSSSEACKRQKLSPTFYEEEVGLIPSLPDEISIQILARVPRIHYLKLKSVSRAWRNAISGSEIYSLRKELGTSEEWLYILTKVNQDKLLWYGLDPSSSKWQRLPLMPTISFEDETRKGLGSLRLLNMVGSTLRVADFLRGWLKRNDVLEWMAFCGCAVAAVNGSLYVLGGFSKACALRCVWRYDLALNRWSEVTPMSTGRAYCKTGILNNKLYVVGGVTRGRSGLTPLQSAEVYDSHTNEWSEIPSMPFTKAQVLPTAFLADLLKPIATGMTSYRGRLFVPQSLYCWPFFVDVGGEVYDPEVNSWAEMPAGMGEGWPARQAGTKLSVTVEGELYSLDPSSSLDDAKIKVYDHQDDAWKVVADQVPIRDFADSEAPYLLASLLGMLHVITKDANGNILVMQADVHARVPSASPSSSSKGSSSRMGIVNDLWRVLSTKNAGPAELVSCQTLDI
ncbi:hypothetical protein MLD38_022962 [Melastoma candidum]|uniref:Uncharacterized protein n=1 Tax=Melastoma candidum TaxID=119954 RepID=A0ACB9QKW7_9MYRT|nr:hypothetical protein MLD38_022962 [Melastoma candidum]